MLNIVSTHHIFLPEKNDLNNSYKRYISPHGTLCIYEKKAGFFFLEWYSCIDFLSGCLKPLEWLNHSKVTWMSKYHKLSGNFLKWQIKLIAQPTLLPESNLIIH